MSTAPNKKASGDHGRWSAIWINLIRAHDRIFSDDNRHALKRMIVKASIAGFLVHLLLIFLSRRLAHPPVLIGAVGKNYLSIISTPFNFILFYEVLTLIAALPASTTRSIANQFEIVSLVFIRDVFKDIAAANEPDWVHQHWKEAMPMFFDMWAGLLMFVLVAVFQQVAQRQVRMPRTVELAAGREKFIAQKKVVAIGLTLLLLALAAWQLGVFVEHTYRAVSSGQAITLEPATHFYNDVFTVMIFTDVLILILSLVVSGRYEMVFRNAAYVISIILIRFSLTESRPFGAALALLAMIFGILTILIFNYHSRIRLEGEFGGDEGT